MLFTNEMQILTPSNRGNYLDKTAGCGLYWSKCKDWLKNWKSWNSATSDYQCDPLFDHNCSTLCYNVNQHMHTIR